jgi:hypothetical protein
MAGVKKFVPAAGFYPDKDRVRRRHSSSTGGFDPQVDHGRLLDLSGGRQTIQILAAAPKRPWE